MKTQKIRRNEIYPRARTAGLLPEAVTDLMDEQARLASIRSAHPDPEIPSGLDIGGDPVALAKKRLKALDQKRLASETRQVVNDAVGVVDRKFKATVLELADTIIENQLRDFAGDLVDQARPHADTLQRFHPVYDLDEIHDQGTPDEVAAIDTSVPLYKDWRLAVQLWDRLLKAGPPSAPPVIEAFWLFEHPEQADPIWTGKLRSGANPVVAPVYELLALASEPVDAGFRFASPLEAADIAKTLTRPKPSEPLTRKKAMF